jgi:hypothetical protein
VHEAFYLPDVVIACNGPLQRGQLGSLDRCGPIVNPDGARLTYLDHRQEMTVIHSDDHNSTSKNQVAIQ